MKACFCQFGLGWLISIFALLTLYGNIELVFGQSSPPSANPHPQLFREIETSLKVEPGSTVVEFTITNRSQDTRYVLVPLDLTPYRIRLTTKHGSAIAMTPKGKYDLTEPAAGSVRGVLLETGVPWTHKIDLGPLFEFPKNEEVRCEVSRHVRFNHPDIKQGEIEWIPFPPVIIRTGSPMARSAMNPAPEFQESAAEVAHSFIGPSSQPPMHSDALKNAPTTLTGDTSGSSTPWSIIILVMIVAAAGLLWLLVKKWR